MISRAAPRAPLGSPKADRRPIQADTPGPERESNWLPAPAGADFTLYLRAYGPTPAAIGHVHPQRPTRERKIGVPFPVMANWFPCYVATRSMFSW
jgi:hypothetical protein